ncbi:MAG: zinc ABC transporter substrate-binding protein [Eubacterium sp.]|nr:zinc ABC transporter substrate-binding protein [Eubacterium sp.]
MKRILSALLIITILICSTTLASCSVHKEKEQNRGEEITIITTIFPIYDWLRNITQNVNSAKVAILADSGADLHSFQPTAEDIINIQNCDLFVFVGGESDEWAEDTVENANNPDMIALNLLSALGGMAKQEEIIEGMQEEKEKEEKEEEKKEYDEHIWLSLKNSKFLVDVITKALCEADKNNAALYKSNASKYSEKLSSLDEKYENCVNSAKNNTLLFGDRFPFRYLTDDYSINYYAAFVGCSAETEASFETISFLSDKIDELLLKYVIVLEGTDHSIAKTIIENTATKDAEIIMMNSMQSIAAKDIKSGVTYISLMQENLEALEKALN